MAASTSLDGDARLRLACDACDASVWIGPESGGIAALCEACQRAVALPRGAESIGCPACGRPLTTGSPRFAELYGDLQHLEAVLAAWAGDVAPLEAILPARPGLITDLTPPAPASGDDVGTREVLDLVRHGHYREALAHARAPGAGSASLAAALAIASERLGDEAAAERSWSRVIELADGPRARLARGALAARRGDHESARADFDRAGDSYEARWNRAALEVLDAVASTPGLPASERIAGARGLAEAPSGEWHENTVGRLLWTLLVKRSLSRAGTGASACPDERVMRAAELELEFDSFWDRALVLHGYVVLGMRAEAGRLVRELATSAIEGLLGATYMQGAAAAPLRSELEGVARDLAGPDPASARSRVASLMERPHVRAYRWPCAACGKGSIGVAEVAPAG